MDFEQKQQHISSMWLVCDSSLCCERLCLMSAEPLAATGASLLAQAPHRSRI
jgi:hypothetical protein